MRCAKRATIPRPDHAGRGAFDQGGLPHLELSERFAYSYVRCRSSLMCTPDLAVCFATASRSKRQSCRRGGAPSLIFRRCLLAYLQCWLFPHCSHAPGRSSVCILPAWCLGGSWKFICPYFANYHVAVWFYCDEDAADPRVNVFRESSQWGPEFNRWTFSNWLLQELNGSLLI